MSIFSVVLIDVGLSLVIAGAGAFVFVRLLGNLERLRVFSLAKLGRKAASHTSSGANTAGISSRSLDAWRYVAASYRILDASTLGGGSSSHLSYGLSDVAHRQIRPAGWERAMRGRSARPKADLRSISPKRGFRVRGNRVEIVGYLNGN